MDTSYMDRLQIKYNAYKWITSGLAPMYSGYHVHEHWLIVSQGTVYIVRIIRHASTYPVTTRAVTLKTLSVSVVPGLLWKIDYTIVMKMIALPISNGDHFTQYLFTNETDWKELWYLTRVIIPGLITLFSMEEEVSSSFNTNSSPPWQNGRHCADDVFKCIFMNEKFCILNRHSPKFVLKGLIKKKSVLVQVMAWRRVGDKPLTESKLIELTDAYKMVLQQSYL